MDGLVPSFLYKTHNGISKASPQAPVFMAWLALCLRASMVYARGGEREREVERLLNNEEDEDVEDEEEEAAEHTPQIKALKYIGEDEVMMTPAFSARMFRSEGPLPIGFYGQLVGLPIFENADTNPPLKVFYRWIQMGSTFWEGDKEWTTMHREKVERIYSELWDMVRLVAYARQERCNAFSTIEYTRVLLRDVNSYLEWRAAVQEAANAETRGPEVFFRSNTSKMLKSLILGGINFLFDIFILGNFNFRAQILILKTAVYSSKIHQNSFTQIVTTYYL
jgi:hypothetical protein